MRGRARALFERLSVERPLLARVIANTGWLTVERLLRLVLGLFIGLWVARYLGKTEFGILSYAIALVGLLASVSTLGLESLVVRDVVRDEETRAATLGTAFFLLLGSNALIAGIGVVVWLTGATEPVVGLMILLLAVGQLGQCMLPVEYWFASQIQSRYIVFARGGGMVAAAALKVGLILSSAPVWTFAAAAATDLLLGGLGLALAYRLRGGSMRLWRFSARRARELIGESWPLIVSAVAVILFLRIDQVMLKVMKGPDALGLYAAAVRVSELWYFVPTAIASSAFPLLVAARETDTTAYHHKLRMLFGCLGGLSLAVATGIAFGADHVMALLYGSGFDGAGPILTLHVWAGVPVALGAAFQTWMFIEGHVRHAMWRTISGAVLNIGLNLVLIPKYGGIGAASATIAAQLWSAVLANVVHPATREGGMYQLRALLPTSWIWALANIRRRGGTPEAPAPGPDEDEGA